jgi:hypothetical protein
LFGYSLSGIRLFSTLAGIGIIVLVCLMAIEMGAQKLATIFLAGFAVLSFLPFYRNHTLFQPVAFDQFFWTLGFYFIILFINRKDNKYLVYTGITSGLGLLNKYTFVVWIAAVIMAFLFHERASLFRNKYLYVAFAIVIVMALPNIMWQIQNDFPAIAHQKRLTELQLDKIDRFDFVTDQLQFLFTLLLSLVGLTGLFLNRELKRFMVIGFSVVIIFFAMWVLKAKPYYFFAAYPVLFAAGAVTLEKIFNGKTLPQYLVAAILFIPIVYFIPQLTPVLPVKDYVAYRDIKPDSAGRYILSNDYADMFGWEEQVALVDSIYQSLPQVERKSAVIWAENYGEAGAVKILGEAYNLPDPFCLSGSFWTFGPPPSEYSVCISLGNEAESVNQVFEEVHLVRMIRHPFAIGEENNIPVYICRKPRINFRERWPELKRYIFS